MMTTRYFSRFFFFLILLIAQLGMSSFGFLEPAGLMKVARKPSAVSNDSLTIIARSNGVAMIEQAQERVKEHSKNSVWTSLLVQKMHFYMKSFVGKMCSICVKCTHIVVLILIESIVK